MSSRRHQGLANVTALVAPAVPWVSVLRNSSGTYQVAVPRQSTLSIDWKRDIWAARVTEHLYSQYVDQRTGRRQSAHRQTLLGIRRVCVDEAMSKIIVLLVVHNLFNRNPPATNQDGSSFQFCYNPLLADPTRRAICATLTADF